MKWDMPIRPIQSGPLTDRNMAQQLRKTAVRLKVTGNVELEPGVILPTGAYAGTSKQIGVPMMGGAARPRRGGDRIREGARRHGARHVIYGARFWRPIQRASKCGICCVDAYAMHRDAVGQDILV
jgi:hypothetical protein